MVNSMDRIQIVMWIKINVFIYKWILTLREIVEKVKLI